MSGEPKTDAASLPANEQAPIRYAGFWMRVAANLLDAIFVAAASVIISLLIEFLLVSFGIVTIDSETGLFLRALFYPVALIGLGLMVAKYGGSPGKLALELRIVRYGGQQRIPFGKALLRQFLLSITFCGDSLTRVDEIAPKMSATNASLMEAAVGLICLGLIVSMIAAISSVSSDYEHRGWHDRLVGSAVVYKS
ncbi:MAG: RDD family protein [Bdellovibrionota bacterium]